MKKGEKEPIVGVEPTTFYLQGKCSTTKLYRRVGHLHKALFQSSMRSDRFISDFQLESCYISWKLNNNQIMGCQSCKVTIEDQIFRTCGGRDDNQVVEQIGTLLNFQERGIWLENIRTAGIPDQRFWEGSREARHPCFTQIKKDISRSFPDSLFFANRNNQARFELLLRKFALYFPKVGYTQGLNFVAGYILMAGFNDEDAFTVLTNLALHQKLLLIGMYEDSFPLNRLYCAIFWKLLEKRLPKTALKIKQAQLPDEIWIFQWFISFYLYSFPVAFVKRFFDYIICKKEFSMITMAIGIVNSLKIDINNMVNPDQFQFFEYLDKLKSLEFCQNKIDIDKAIGYANSITKYQIHQALEQVKVGNNIYHVYFLKDSQRSQIWKNIMKKLDHERKMFCEDPRSSQYKRDRNAVEHLEMLLLRKSKLYRSRTDSKYSSQIRTSNYAIEFILDSEHESLSEIVSPPSNKSSKQSSNNAVEAHLKKSSPIPTSISSKKVHRDDSTNSRESQNRIRYL